MMEGFLFRLSRVDKECGRCCAMIPLTLVNRIVSRPDSYREDASLISMLHMSTLGRLMFDPLSQISSGEIVDFIKSATVHKVNPFMQGVITTTVLVLQQRRDECKHHISSLMYNIHYEIGDNAAVDGALETLIREFNELGDEIESLKEDKNYVGDDIYRSATWRVSRSADGSVSCDMTNSM